MSVETERYIHSDAPDPAQLRQLAAVGISSVVARQKLKSPARFPNSHYFIDTVDAIAEEPMNFGDGQMEIYHRVAGRMGRDIHSDAGVKLRKWSLKMYDVYAMRGKKDWVNMQALYKFGWDDQKTLVAERMLRIIDANGVQVHDTADAIDNFFVPDNMAALWHAETEMSLVTAPECDELIEGMQRYFSMVEETSGRE